MRAVFSLLSPGGSAARLSTFIFHRVLPRPDPLFPGELDADRFDAICRWLRRWFVVLPLDQALRRLAQGGLPARAAAITFDDGYADNVEIAMPLLQRHGLSATFFVASGFLDGGRMWNDGVIEALRGCRLDSVSPCDLGGVLDAPLPSMSLVDAMARRSAIDRVIAAIKYLEPERRQRAVDQLARVCGAALPSDLMMTTSQLRRLRGGGMAVGAHTLSHPILARLDDCRARHEIVAGRDRLRELLDDPIPLFAYPNGKPGQDYSSQTVALVRGAGFDGAVSTGWGVATRRTDAYQIPRFTPWDRDRGRFALRLMRNLLQAA